VPTLLKHARQPESGDQQHSKRRKEELYPETDHGHLSTGDAAAHEATSNEFARIAPEVQTLLEPGKLEVLSNGSLKAFAVRGKV
jgi:hypothetical protein